MKTSALIRIRQESQSSKVWGWVARFSFSETGRVIVSFIRIKWKIGPDGFDLMRSLVLLETLRLIKFRFIMHAFVILLLSLLLFFYDKTSGKWVYIVDIIVIFSFLTVVLFHLISTQKLFSYFSRLCISLLFLLYP